MISGYENLLQVRAHLEALRRERDEAIMRADGAALEAVDEQLEIFEAEAERLGAEEAEPIRRQAEAQEQAIGKGIDWRAYERAQAERARALNRPVGLY
jgi:hypothetical protein